MKLRFITVSYLIVNAFFANSQISNEDFNTLINNQFRSLLNEDSNGGTGGFASANIKDSKVTFAPSFNFKNGDILGLKLTGGITDGISQIATDSKFNTNISFDIAYNFYNLKNQQTLNYYSNSKDSLEKMKIAAKQAFEIDILKISYKEDLRVCNESLSKAKQQRDTLKAKSIQTDSVKYQIALLKLKIVSLEEEQKHLVDKNWLPNATLEAFNKKIKAQNAASDLNVNVTGFQFGWFSLRYQARHDGFNLFDSLEIFDNQINKKRAVSHQFEFLYSYYKWSNHEPGNYLFQVGATYSLSNNIADLTKTDITESTLFGNSTNTRTSAESFIAYTGDYLDNINQLLLRADLYYFILKNNTLGLHVYPNVLMKDKSEPRYNIGFGTVFSMRDKAKEKAKINAELYYNFRDIFNSSNSKLDLFERNEIGLRLTFPINFN